MTINKENQINRSSDVVSVLVHVGAVLLVVSIILTGNFATQKEAQAKRRAEGLAYQILQIENQKGAKEATLYQDRFIASEPNSISEIGEDPWGQSYLYEVLHSSSGKTTQYILVWSKGPNRNQDTASLSYEDLSAGKVPAFLGDDVGVVIESPYRPTY